MIEKEHFYTDLDHIYNTIIYHTLKRKGQSLSTITSVTKAPMNYMEWYASQDYKRAVGIISDYLCSRLHDYRYEEMDGFFKRNRIERDVTYFRDLINFIEEELKNRKVLFRDKDIKLLAVIIATPTAITYTKDIIERASIYCNLTITKDNIVALSNRILSLVNRSDTHTTVFDVDTEQTYSNLFIKEVKEDVWELEGAEIFAELFKRRNN